MAAGLSATQLNVAESDAAGSVKAQRLHNVFKQCEVSVSTNRDPSASTVAKNASERTDFPDELKSIKIKT